jgi:hypothetical protein
MSLTNTAQDAKHRMVAARSTHSISSDMNEGILALGSSWDGTRSPGCPAVGKTHPRGDSIPSTCAVDSVSSMQANGSHSTLLLAVIWS